MRFFFPILEETFKILPVILCARALKRTKNRQFNISDWIALGSMSGVAFSMLEDYYRSGSYGEHFGPHIGSFYIFPDAFGYTYDRGLDLIGYVGHGAGTAFIALSIGAGIYLSKKFKKDGLKWQVPAVVFAWVTFEHMAYNAGADTPIMSMIFGLLGNGMLTPWILLIAIASGIGIDIFNFIKAYKDLPKFKLVARYGIDKKTPLSFTFVMGCFNALRFLNQVALRYFFKN